MYYTYMYYYVTSFEQNKWSVGIMRNDAVMEHSVYLLTESVMFLKTVKMAQMSEIVLIHQVRPCNS